MKTTNLTWMEAVGAMLNGARVRQASKVRHEWSNVGNMQVLDTGTEAIRATTVQDINQREVTVMCGVDSREPVTPDLQMVSATDWEIVK